MEIGLGQYGSSELGYQPFRFVTEVVRAIPGRNILVPGFSFRSLGCYEFVEECVAGIDWLRWLEYGCESVEVRYRGKEVYRVWCLAPLEVMEEAKAKLVEWVEVRDVETHDDTSFAICLHYGFAEFQEAIAWWSTSDATVITLQEDVAKEIFESLTRYHQEWVAEGMNLPYQVNGG